jgi:hypothetical protein
VKAGTVVVLRGGAVVVVEGAGVVVATDVDVDAPVEATVGTDGALPAETPRPDVHAANPRAATTPAAPHR